MSTKIKRFENGYKTVAVNKFSVYLLTSQQFS